MYQALPTTAASASAVPPMAAAPGWVSLAGGLVEIGQAGAGFAFDNERPRHAQFLQPYRLARRPVGQGDWAAFIADWRLCRPALVDVGRLGLGAQPADPRAAALAQQR